MKIHIIGGPGSGKSFLADELSKELGIPHYDPDEMQWDHRANAYGTKRDPQERAALLNRILQREDWIIEGVYSTWCRQCFEEADKIYVLKVPRHQYRYRIIRRFIRRKLGWEPGKKESLKTLAALLRWADHYQKVNLLELKTLLEPYSSKVIERFEP